MAILGIDEVGRGPLAGPLVVGAVVLPGEECEWFGELRDSKKLTARKREELSEMIMNEASVGLGWVPAHELDKMGISEALKLACRRAVKSVQSLHAPFSQIVIDGKVNFLKGTPLEEYTTTVIKADDKIREVSAASIAAKVARDKYMVELGLKYPEYGFEKHVGYGTKAHVAAIYKYGLTDEHRRSFEPCKSLCGFESEPTARKNTTSVGKRAEAAVAEYLTGAGHTIVARNHKTYFYEIDVISVKGEKVYFTEVKYRANNVHGSGFEAVTVDKMKRMQFAAESYLKYTAKTLGDYDPVLAVAAVSGEDFRVDEWFLLV